MSKKLFLLVSAFLVLAVVNLSVLVAVLWRQADARERQIVQLEAQLAQMKETTPATPPAPRSQLSPMEEIHRAVNAGDVPRLRALLDGHPDLLNATTHNRFGSTPLQFAAWNNQPEAAAELIRRGAEVNAVNKDGRTALHDAISAGSQAIVRQLLDRGANIHLQSNAGKDAVAYAAERKQTIIVEMLRQHEQTARAQ